MNKQQPSGRSNRKAFTLVEMLVVIAVIGILAAMIIPAAGSANAKMALRRAEADRSQLETAIDNYKSKRGVYPPDNAYGTNAAMTPLFFELAGTVYTNTPPASFFRMHGTEASSQANIQTACGIGGFFNSAYVADRNNNVQLQQADVRDFLEKLDSTKYLAITNKVGVRAVSNVVFGLPSEGPLMLAGTTTGVRINPWRYVSNNPTNNPGSYDLWIDIIIQGKTNRVSNWKREPEIVY
jgi:prepilin-type N-terminal cleavage/methylation domain-containing protein